MLQISDRKQWLALLSRAPMQMLENALVEHRASSFTWLRAPVTGLMMVQGRIGGNGERFNVGEVTVTRCALRMSVGPNGLVYVGVGTVLGRSHDQAKYVALADGLLQDSATFAILNEALLVPIKEFLQGQKMRRQIKAQSTKVEFFTVAREASAGEDSNV
jgi:alpha-D-ribose 1-methylphosphonate 5-triphosphate synthase subunit PhnG